MKKIFSSLLVSFLLLPIMTCELPSEMELKGTPNLQFLANMDLGKMFSEMITEQFDSGESELTLLDAVNAGGDYKTFVIRKEVVNINLGDEIEDPHLLIGANISYDFDKDLLAEPMMEPFPSLSLGDDLGGLQLNADGLKAYLYIDGAEVVEQLSLGLQFGSSAEVTFPILRKSSGIDLEDRVFGEMALSEGTYDISDEVKKIIENPLENQNGDNIYIRPYLVEGKVIKGSQFLDANITAEVAIWFPVRLKAGAAERVEGIAKPGAKLQIQELQQAGDFIQQLAESKIIEGVNLKLEMSGNSPLRNGWVVLQNANPPYTIKTQAGETSVNIDLSQADIDFINDNKENFNPSMSVFFEEGAEINIPKELKIETVGVDAEISVSLLE
jgi:hypothetical protein